MKKLHTVHILCIYSYTIANLKYDCYDFICIANYSRNMCFFISSSSLSIASFGGAVTTFSPICVQPGITIGGVTFERADTIV